jgi:Tetratricopeptide repeat
MNRQILPKMEKGLGEDHPDTLTSVSNLALVLQYQGKYEQAEEMNQRALTERKEVLAVGHPDTLTSVNSLASIQGKLR